MASPTVSVIIPCYNQGQYVAMAVQSVLDQTFNDYEIILVDDGSTDETGQVLTGLATRNPGTVHLVEQSNQGLSMARQAGLDRAQGEFMIFLDADDRLEPGMMERCLASLRRWPEASAIVGRTQLRYERDPAQVRIIGVGTNLQWPAILESNPFGACCSLMLRKAQVQEAGGVGLPGVRACEDWDLYIRMARRGMVFRSIPEVLSQYLQHENVLSQNIEKMLEAKIEMLARVERDAAAAAPGNPLAVTGPLAQYRNGYVFFALGQAVGRQYDVAALSAILARLARGGLAFRHCCNQFLYGLQHSLFLNHKIIAKKYIGEICKLVETHLSDFGFKHYALMVSREIGREMKAPLKGKSFRRAFSRFLDPVRQYWLLR